LFFSGLRSFWQSQVFKIGFKVLAKVLAGLVQVFSPGLFFLASLFFGKVSFLAKVLASPRLWRFGQSVAFSKTKSGL